jgi:nucleoside-triphosphatase THEP1
MPVQTPLNSPDALLASFVSPGDIKPGLVIITGKRGSGKTLWCLELVKQTHFLGLNPSGLVSPAILECDQKVGIDLLDLTSGQRQHLAYRTVDAPGDLQNPNWQMISGTLDWGNSILESIDLCDLFILDEIGPLELEQGIGLMSGLDIIDSRKSFPCFVVVRPALLVNAQKRWPWAQIVDLAAEIEA